ncbi:MAG: hypothetical protein RL220_541 [Bacteroidota bacterium]
MYLVKKTFLNLGTAIMLLAVPFLSHAQDEPSLMDLLGEDEEINFASYTFKSTRVINGHSVENAAHGVLDFRISHRFGAINGGINEFFGLDGATIRLGLEYGVTDRLMVGLGRSSLNKTVDGFAKFKILRQSSGGRNMPVSVSAFSSVALQTVEWADPDRENFFTSRLFYAHQLLIARKFNKSLSLQLTPTLVHRNLVATKAESNDVLAMGIGGRQKLTNRTSLNFEYFYVLPDQLADTYRNSFSLGFDIETGGHVFQLHFTNSQGMIEKAFVAETDGNWLDGDIAFGFNISRVFTLHKPKLPKE